MRLGTIFLAAISCLASLIIAPVLAMAELISSLVPRLVDSAASWQVMNRQPRSIIESRRMGLA